jgi:hypothetical protein
MLRQELQTMTDVEDGIQHPALLEAVRKEYPNTVQIVHSSYPLERYTCLVHALGFVEQPEYLAIAARPFNHVAYASPDFPHWLLDHNLLQEVSPADACRGDFVFYFNDEGRLKHAGLYLENGRVLSKWGLGYLYNHALFEVPERYGNTVRYFKRMTFENVLDQFKRFAKERGILV